MKKSFALAVALTIALSATPASAFTRDGGGRDRGFNPFERIVRIIKKLIGSPLDELGQPHP
ncbi:MAG TPA: hypothetical protein VII75_13640 [Thermoanaerobaculia bacterium]|jgi:hypothetical protein